MKAAILFIASLVGGLAVGATGRGFMMDPPPVEEAEHAEDGTIAEGGIGIDIVNAGEHGADADTDAGDATDGDHTAEDQDAGAQDGAGTGEDAAQDEAAGPTEDTSREQSGAEAPPLNGGAPTSEPQTVNPGAAGNDAGMANRSTTPPVSALPDTAAPKRLADIFGSMEPRSAAAVMIELTNNEVTQILARMSTRKAGDIIDEISKLSAERAAELSRSMLMRGGE